ncbi:glucosamine-6-phosphate deaminase [Paenibacillus cremeus]|uniref:Glucosamine-6-phosphate deaminase n=1 Tax=Paenibacillus cremeus TaxID=2163881 RepID=A0A559K9U2_9BACL|nr:glucosamine-6-phosphate deaminase [Paenibacillus cremeus]TVY08900.1 glucosamine-6-phosphate deaminase [Paenibacillus cremeus]
MNVRILENAKVLGQEAAEFCAQELRRLIKTKGKARLVLSTGASQFETLESLVTMDIDWSRVEMFHLDEYVNLPYVHPASFRKYLTERFLDQLPIPLGEAHFVNGEGDLETNIATLTREIRKAPIDLALIGIGENAHIAFNDPPADFDTQEAYIVVNLDDKCKKQQVGEGWFDTLDDVPTQAITMTVHQILQSAMIVSCVPHKVKAHAIRDLFMNDVTNQIPATILKNHPSFTLFIDENSASEVDRELIGHLNS